MDINQLRGWAAFMDKAVIVSLIATVMAVAALGITTFLSFRFSGAVRAHEQAVLDGYKGAEGHSLQLERDVATARERVSTLEQEVATARQQSAALEQQVTAAREKAATVEQEVSAARERAESSGQAARDANDRAARADRETAEATAKERALELDAAEIRQRLAELGQQVRKAAEQAPKPAEPATKPAEQATKADPPEAAAPGNDKPASLVVESLRKYAGTKAAVFVIDRVSGAPAAGAEIATDLSDAGWEPQTWKWTGVAGIFGVVVLVKDGSDPSTNEAASTLVEQLRANAFSATKGDWPANWSLYRGTLDGPQTPGPTDAPIRIVVGVKPR
jgi:chemotaxis protein histidine kinase CheA